jgi:hypothetical protein
MIDMSETVHIRVACRVFAAKNTEIKKNILTINITCIDIMDGDYHCHLTLAVASGVIILKFGWMTQQ